MVRQLVLVAALVVLAAVRETFAGKPEGIIVGSRSASPGDVPYQVSLRNRNNHFCGGSLIGKQYVLTAASCFEGLVKSHFIGITVVTGTINITEGEHHKIKDVVVHPDYVYDTHGFNENDIAIITLEAPITSNELQTPIRVASHDPPEGASLLSSRWGLFIVNGVLTPKLQVVAVRVLNNQHCPSYVKGQAIVDTNLCTDSANGKSACSGDSGNPLVFNDELVGITSFVYPCAQGLFDIYIKTSRYMDFINSIVQG